MAKRFDITKIAICDTIQSRRDAYFGSNVTQADESSIECGGFDLLERTVIVNCGYHMVNRMIEPGL